MRPTPRFIGFAALVTVVVTTAPAFGIDLQEKRRVDVMIWKQITACWNPPAQSGAQGEPVTVQFELDRHGALSKGPDILNHPTGEGAKIKIAAAERAVRQCQPLRLPSEDYEYWRLIRLAFHDAPQLLPPRPAAPASPQ